MVGVFVAFIRVVYGRRIYMYTHLHQNTLLITANSYCHVKYSVYQNQCVNFVLVCSYFGLWDYCPVMPFAYFVKNIHILTMAKYFVWARRGGYTFIETFPFSYMFYS